MRRYIARESIDLCYIDPPFNSKRNYFQIYRGINEQTDKAQARAFEDTWEWGKKAEAEYDDIQSAGRDYTRQTIELLRGLENVLGRKGLFAYLVSMTIRLNEIWQCLKPSGSFYLHCDQSASHYLKLILDTIYLARDGRFRNDLVWCYSNIGAAPKKRYPNKHDNLLFYTKSKESYFQQQNIIHHRSNHQAPAPNWWIDIPSFNGYMKPANETHLGYPTQKPRALLERILKTSSRDNDLIMDCYCGCGTTIDAAHKLHRRWIGMDITYQAIALVLTRLKQYEHYNPREVKITGIPQDIASARDLAHSPDDKTRKEFEIWAVLNFTENNGIPNDKKGGDEGSDGVVYFHTSKDSIDKASLEVKSGKNITHAIVDRVESGMKGLNAPLGYLLTLEKPSKGICRHAADKGYYKHPVTGNRIHRVQIITIQEMLDGKTISKTGILPIATTRKGKPLTSQHPELGLGS